MIKKIQYLIFPALILLVALSVYLLDKDINKYSEVIAEQQTRINNIEKQYINDYHINIRKKLNPYL